MWTSLRLRLLIVWAIFIALTLQVAGIGLRVLFERSIARRTQTELEADLRQLHRGMVTTNGKIAIAREPTDPQFDIPLGGRYWQINEANSPILRSRSLEAASLVIPTPLQEQLPPSMWLFGPKQEKLFAVIRRHAANTEEGAAKRDLVFVTAVDAAEISDDTAKFTSELFKSLSVLALLLLAGAWAHVTVGLHPLKSISEKISLVREGRARRLEGAFPDEVMPLVSETNDLLAAQETALRKARDRAGDLAHGLKTPLAVLAANARTLRREGKNAIADEIDRQIDSMGRHVERELARARARGANRIGQPSVEIAGLLHQIVGVIDSLPRADPLQWTLDIPDDLNFSVDADDFNNIAGNLLENASKWCAARIGVSLFKTPNGISITVDDDGPGIPEDKYEVVLRRGERMDTSVAGSGLGLAIVNDLVMIYGGTLALSRSDFGGLNARVDLPDTATSAH